MHFQQSLCHGRATRRRGEFFGVSDGRKHHRAAPKPRGARTIGRGKRKSGINSVAFTNALPYCGGCYHFIPIEAALNKTKGWGGGTSKGRGGRARGAKQGKQKTYKTEHIQNTTQTNKKQDKPPEAQATTRKSAINTNSKTQHKTPYQGQQPQTQNQGQQPQTQKRPPETTLLVF